MRRRKCPIGSTGREEAHSERARGEGATAKGRAEGAQEGSLGSQKPSEGPGEPRRDHTDPESKLVSRLDVV